MSELGGRGAKRLALSAWVLTFYCCWERGLLLLCWPIKIGAALHYLIKGYRSAPKELSIADQIQLTLIGWMLQLRIALTWCLVKPDPHHPSSFALAIEFQCLKMCSFKDSPPTLLLLSASSSEFQRFSQFDLHHPTALPWSMLSCHGFTMLYTSEYCLKHAMRSSKYQNLTFVLLVVSPSQLVLCAITALPSYPPLSQVVYHSISPSSSTGCYHPHHSFTIDAHKSFLLAR